MRVEVLGNVQDGGVPHLGCDCDICEAAREDPRKQKYVGSLIIKENGEEDTVRYLVDASPDMRFQIKGDYLDGVFLSHGHLGHVHGLLYFGTESLDTDKLAVNCTPEMRQFIMNNDPYRILVDRGQVEIHEFSNRDEIEIQGGSIEPRSVIHRYVTTDTVSFMIKGEEKDLYYLSDIDEWTEEAVASVREADIAVIDGTFWDKEEIDRYEEVPHPPIIESMNRFEDSDTEIWFTHLNHTNPALREDSEERRKLEEKGYKVVEKGTTFEI